MMNNFQRTRAIFMATVMTLRKQPNLLWFPLLAIVGIFIVLVSGLLLMILCGSISGLHVGDGENPPQRLQTLVGLLVAFGIQIISVISNIALSYAAMESLSGRPWSLSAALARANLRAKAALQFALLNWVVGLLRRRRSSANIKPFGLLNLTWRVASYLAIPVITREGCEGFQAIRRSSQLVTQTWQESIVGNLILKGLWLPLIALTIVPIGLLAAFDIEHDTLIFAVIATTFTFAGLGALVIQVIEAIYRAALYIFASEGIVPENYQCSELTEIWTVKRCDIP